MEKSVTTTDAVGRRGLFIGKDYVLYQEVEAAVQPAMHLSMEHEPPNIWPQDLDTVFIQATDRATTLDRIKRVVNQSNGVEPFVLLPSRDIDFVLEASRAGVKAFIEVPDEVPETLSIVHMARRRHQGRGGVVSAFFSLKGGVGRTTLATHTAAQLAELTSGHTVLVDLDIPLGDVALYMDLDETYSITDFIYNMVRFDEKLIYDSLTRHDSGVYLLGLPKRFEELDTITPDGVKATLGLLRRYFDHVIVDCASDLAATTLTCLDDADNLILVTEPALASLRATQTAYDVGRQLGYDLGKIKMVLNRHTAFGEELVDEVIEAMELPVSARVANSYAEFLQALNRGVLLHEYAPGSLADRQLRAIAEMLHRGAPHAEEPSRRNPRFRFLQGLGLGPLRALPGMQR